jgi:hypothetical protein
MAQTDDPAENRNHPIQAAAATTTLTTITASRTLERPVGLLSL